MAGRVEVELVEQFAHELGPGSRGSTVVPVDNEDLVNRLERANKHLLGSTGGCTNW